MDHSLARSAAINTSSKRRYKFLRFKLEPGDGEFIDRLPEEQRVLLLANGSYADKATHFNIPVGTVRSRLHRARAAVVRLRYESRAKVQPEATSVLN